MVTYLFKSSIPIDSFWTPYLYPCEKDFYQLDNNAYVQFFFLCTVFWSCYIRFRHCFLKLPRLIFLFPITNECGYYSFVIHLEFFCSICILFWVLTDFRWFYCCFLFVCFLFWVCETLLWVSGLELCKKTYLLREVSLPPVPATLFPFLTSYNNFHQSL